MKQRVGIILVAAVAVSGVLAEGTGTRPEILADASQAPPLLSQTGLYDARGAIDAGNLPFVPQYPLWSDGAAKSRWIHLPERTRIDVSSIDAWRFPEGTKIWKEFAFGGRRVETRMLWKKDDAWVFATYVWAEDQSDAWLAPASGVPDVVEVAPGKRHAIPGIQDCHACHGSSPSAVLGFGALQLSDDRDPLAPHAEASPPGALTLRSLVETDRLAPPRPDLVSRPPRVRERDPIARAAVGYLSANCGVCHNGSGPLSRLGLNLLHDASGEPMAPEPVRSTAVGAAGRYVVPGQSHESSRLLAPGAPERSALLHRMQSRRPSSQMPPLGTVVADEEAVALVRSFIEEMERSR